MSFLLTLVIFGILIVVHEFGHFIAARHSGVRVEKFSIGFGPPLFKFKGKETEFLVCIFPLGGYVKLAGDNRSESEGKPDEFLSKSPGIRGKIVFAGVFFNYLFALIIFWLIALIGFPYQDTVIGGAFSDYPAHESGLEEGDRIVAVNGKEITGWRELERKIHKSQGEVSLSVERGDQIISVLTSLKQEEITDEFGRKVTVSMLGVFPYRNTTIGNLLEKYPAKEAGLKQGDKIVAVGGVYVDSWKEMAELIHKTKDKVSLTIEREGEIISVVTDVKKDEITNSDGKKELVSLIGIGPYAEVQFKRYPFFKAFLKGTETLFGLTADILKGFSAIITGTISFKEGAAGPIGIFYITSEYIKVGFVAVLQLMAALNISLAIINLFPIPVLDGGHILFLFIEKLRGKPASDKVEDFATRVGLTLLGILFVFITYNDIVRFGSETWSNISNGSVQVWNKLQGKTSE
ncbi:MAG: RIP metalloprotease RseP [Candidatus Omnitrophica bacterium]|nr:RIP metalloprotease RseP [Candidatus Omnitrophota bacterium]